MKIIENVIANNAITGADFYGCSFEEDENQLCFLIDDTKDDFNWTRNRVRVVIHKRA